MDISNLPRPEAGVINLAGPQGNAFFILGLCRKELKKVGWTKEQVDAFTDEATSNDYSKVLDTANKYLDITWT